MGLHPVYDQLTQNLQVPVESWRGSRGTRGIVTLGVTSDGWSFTQPPTQKPAFVCRIFVRFFAIRFLYLHLYLDSGHSADAFIQSDIQ